MPPRRRGGRGEHGGDGFRRDCEQLIAAFRALRRARPELPDEVHDRAQDRAVDAIMRRPSLARLPDGRPSPQRVRALARRHLVWAIKDWQRQRLNPDGRLKPGPRTATSLDAPIATEDRDSDDRHELVGSDLDNPGRVLCDREGLAELADAANTGPCEDMRILSGYLRGESVAEIAEATGLTENTVSARKRRLIQRMKRKR